MLADTKAGVLYHGYLSPWFDAPSAVLCQGSPLLYPHASCTYCWLLSPSLQGCMRHLQESGCIDGVQLPDGSLVPPCHQHANDT
jgi:hypothetical protein